MNRPGHQFFAHTALTANQHGRVGRSDPLDDPSQLVHRLAVTNQFAVYSQLAPQRLVLTLCLRKPVGQGFPILQPIQCNGQLVGNRQGELEIRCFQQVLAIGRIQVKHSKSHVPRNQRGADHAFSMNLPQAVTIHEFAVIGHVPGQHRLCLGQNRSRKVIGHLLVGEILQRAVRSHSEFVGPRPTPESFRQQQHRPDIGSRPRKQPVEYHTGKLFGVTSRPHF